MIQTLRTAGRALGLMAALIPAAGRAAEASFNPQPLPAIDYASLFSNAAHDYNIDVPIKLRLARKATVDDLARKGLEVRIFSLQPSYDDLTREVAGKAQPQSWASVGHCHVFLSLVLRYDGRDLLARHEMDIGPLTTAAGWLAYLDDGTFGSGYYRIVVEPVTADDEPNFADRGGLRGRYEFIRLTDDSLDNYFAQGLFIAVKSAGLPDGRPGQGPAPMGREAAAFQAAARKISSSLHCYAAAPLEAARQDGRLQLTERSACDAAGAGAAGAQAGEELAPPPAP